MAAAIGLGSMDMPVPSIADWEWLNWKFPRPVRAGETIYARWTLTQKRPPVGGAATAIVVWRVDVHTADGALCAEGEVGASVRRQGASIRQPAAEAASTPTPAARRRRRRRSASNGTKPPVEAPAPVMEAAVVAVPAAAATSERSPSGARRRRRRRSPGSPPARGKTEPSSPASPGPVSSPAPTPVPAVSTGAAPAAAKAQPTALGRVIRRLRRT